MTDHNQVTYTTPRFEEKTRAAVLRDGDKTWEKTKEIRKALNKQMEILGHWNALFEAMEAAKVEKVGQLPKDQVEYWKSVLDYPLRLVANL